MIRCEGDERNALACIWDPSWHDPITIDFEAQVPGGKLIGKSIVRWLNADSAYPTVFFSDSQDCILASISNPEDTEDVPWRDAAARAIDINGEREESPLILVPAEEKKPLRRFPTDKNLEDEDATTEMSLDSDEVEDTFQFRKFVER